MVGVTAQYQATITYADGWERPAEGVDWVSRFRHRRDLPSTPDLVGPSNERWCSSTGASGIRTTVVAGGVIPRRISRWVPKLSRNVERDASV